MYVYMYMYIISFIAIGSFAPGRFYAGATLLPVTLLQRVFSNEPERVHKECGDGADGAGE